MAEPALHPLDRHISIDVSPLTVNCWGVAAIDDRDLQLHNSTEITGYMAWQSLRYLHDKIHFLVNSVAISTLCCSFSSQPCKVFCMMFVFRLIPA